MTFSKRKRKKVGSTQPPPSLVVDPRRHRRRGGGGRRPAVAATRGRSTPPPSEGGREEACRLRRHRSGLDPCRHRSGLDPCYPSASATVAQGRWCRSVPTSSKGRGPPPPLGPRAALDLGHRPGPDTLLWLCLLEEAEDARTRALSRYAPTAVLLEVAVRPLPSAAGCSPRAQALDGREVAACRWTLAPTCSRPDLGERTKLVAWSSAWRGEKRGMCGA
jgi:hypothetical protein